MSGLLIILGGLIVLALIVLVIVLSGGKKPQAQTSQTQTPQASPHEMRIKKLEEEREKLEEQAAQIEEERWLRGNVAALRQRVRDLRTPPPGP